MVLTLAAAACGMGAKERPGHLYALLLRPPHDTTRFEAVASARHCAGGGWFIAGNTRGNGVLIWTRSRQGPSTGEFPLLTRGDSVSPRGAMAAARFMIVDASRGVTLDSGHVVVDSGARISARAMGTGVDAAAGHRVAVEARFDSVPLLPDTVACRVQL